MLNGLGLGLGWREMGLGGWGAGGGWGGGRWGLEGQEGDGEWGGQDGSCASTGLTPVSSPDHYVQVLGCKQDCVRELATKPGSATAVEDFLPSHFYLLQSAYHKGGWKVGGRAGNHRYSQVCPGFGAESGVVKGGGSVGGLGVGLRVQGTYSVFRDHMEGSGEIQWVRGHTVGSGEVWGVLCDGFRNYKVGSEIVQWVQMSQGGFGGSCWHSGVMMVGSRVVG